MCLLEYYRSEHVFGYSLTASRRRSGTTRRDCRNPVISRRARVQQRKPDQAQSSSRPGEPKAARLFRIRAHRQRSTRATSGISRICISQMHVPAPAIAFRTGNELRCASGRGVSARYHLRCPADRYFCDRFHHGSGMKSRHSRAQI